MREDTIEKIIELRHLLHRNPELSMSEKETIEILIHFLKEQTDLDIIEKEDWFYAVKRGKSGGKKIAFRADMDALPMDESLPLDYASCRKGVSHKCGHDGHCAVLCGLAIELDRLETDCTVYLIFQPAEETGLGALICKELIREERIEEIFAFHNLPGYPEGTVLYREGLTQPASEGIKIVFNGKTSHASEPEKGMNPAMAMSETVLYSQEVCKKQTERLLLCTVTGMKLGEGDYGISPGKGEVFLTIRAEQEEEMAELETELLNYASNKASEYGLSIEHRISDRFPETRNHLSSLQRVICAADALHLNRESMKDLWRASEDFGFYLKECKGAMFYIGAGEDYSNLHTPEYDFNDGIIPTAVDMFLEIVNGRISECVKRLDVKPIRVWG